MKPQYHVCVASVREIHDMPGSWPDDDYRGLLRQLEVDGVDDIAGADLLEMTLMALQDLEPDDAADAVLAYKLNDAVSSGARRNIVEDLLEEQRPWEEAADISLHSRIFSAAVLLQKVYPKNFNRPDMLQVILDISANTPEATSLLAQPPQAAFVTRMLADAMDRHSILERLFDEQLAAQQFAEADSIIWLAHFDRDDSGDSHRARLTIYSSEHWLESMRSISEFESSAYNDRKMRESEHD